MVQRKLQQAKYPTDFRYFVIYTGYVESLANAPLILSHNMKKRSDDRCKTWQEAWETMFNHVRGLFIESARLHRGLPSTIGETDALRSLEDCCRSAMENSENFFCSQCGTNLSPLRVTDLDADSSVELVTDFIAAVRDSDCIDLDQELCELGWANGWNIPGYLGDKPGLVSVISEYGENFLGDYDGLRNVHDFMWDEKKKFWHAVDIAEYTPLMTPVRTR